MNRSYSKLRHIQEMNKRLDESTITKKVNPIITESFNIKNEKQIHFNLLERQRIIEENIKYNDNLLLSILREQDESGEEEVPDEVVAQYPNEWDEFLKATFKDFYGEEEGEEEEVSEDFLYESIDANLLLERCPEYLGDCFKKWGRKFKRSKFARWYRRNIGEPTVDGFNKLNKKLKRKFKSWMRKLKNIDLDIKIKKAKSLKKTWIGKKAGSKIKIGVSGYITLGKGKGSAQEEFDSEDTFEPSIDPEEYETYLKENEADMISLMSKTSKANWEKLKADPEEIGYSVAVLERFNETYPEKKWKKVGVGLSREVFEQEVQQDPQPEDQPPVEKIYPKIEFEFPLTKEAEPNLFVDNKWDESGAGKFTEEIKALCAKVQEQMATLKPPKDKPKAYLQEAYLASSASRLRNGGDAASLSFKGLSDKRMETAKTIINREFAAIGILVDDKTLWQIDTSAKKSALNPYGNGDGSSGPNGPSDKGYIALGEYPMSPNCKPKENSCVINGKTIPRNQCGTPHTNIAEYNKYKFINGTFVIVFNDSYELLPEKKEDEPTNKEDEPKIEKIETTKYPIYFYAPGKKPFKIPIPGLRIKWKKLFSFKRRSRPTYGPPAGKKNGATKCEAFG